MTRISIPDIATPRQHAAMRPRRGVALLLVLISLGAAAAMTSFYLISQENSAAIGTNAEAATASDWAARSGAKVGLAVLETEADWRSAASADGRIFSDVEIGEAVVTVTVTALDGSPPRDDDRDLVVTSIAVVDGLTSMRQQVVFVTPDADVEESIDDELGEFGVYALEGITVKSGGLITVWNRNPRNPVNKPANLAAGFALTSELGVDEASDILRSALFVTNSASSGLKDLAYNAQFEGGGVIPLDKVPAAPALMPMSLRDLLVAMPTDVDLNLGVGLRAAAGAWQNIEISNGSDLVMGGPAGGQYRVNDLSVSDMGMLSIEGDVELLVTGRLEVTDGAAIHLVDDDATLTLYLMSDLLVDRGGIGVDPAIAALADVDVSLVSEYSDPRRVRIFAVSPVSGGESEPQYHLEHNAIMLASIHAPTARIRLDNESILIGRATSRRISVESDSVVYCDPAIGVETGYTDLDGPLYKEDGQLLDELATAIAAWDDALGLEAFKAHMLSYYTEPVPDGGAAAERGGDATPRIAGRVVAREWPMRAFAMESASRPDSAPDGAGPTPGCNDDGSFFNPEDASGFAAIVENHQNEHGSDGGGASSNFGVGPE